MVTNSSKRGLASVVPSLLAMALMLGAVEAQAVVTESAKVVKTTGQYSPGGFFIPINNTTGNQSFVLSGTTPGFAPELGVDVTATASGSSFFFKHNLWRIGQGSAKFETTVSTTITNTGPDPVSLIFDSLITPGYIAVAGPNPSSNAASFDFSVNQVTDGISTPLYFAQGLAGPGAMPLVITSDGVPLNNLQSFSNSTTFALTWDATKIFLPLASIAAGASTTIVYDLTTSVYGFGGALTDTTCQGSQVAFGDPRNPGGATLGAAGSVLAGIGALLGNTSSPTTPGPCTLSPVIGRLFDPAKVPATTAVPEPASWAMLISGFGLVGATMRRRRTVAAA